MAKDTITGSTSNQYIDSKIEWESTPSVANNSSSVTAKLYYRRNNTGYTTEGTGSFSITINGTKTTKTNVKLTIGTSWVLAMTATTTVDHKDDGSKSITISATGSLPPSSLTSTSCSGTAKLDTIARASVPTVSASSVAMLSSVTITTNRKSSSFTHDLTYSFGGSTGTIKTGVGASYAWTVPDLVSKISGKSSGTCTITCKTYNGTALIGTKTVTLTLTIPAKSTPTASASTVKMGTSVDIYTNRKSTGYTHTLTYTVGTKTGTIREGVAGGRTWTPDKSLAAYTGNKTSATCTITCKTYNGSLLVGEATTSISLKVPDATVPTLSASSIVLGNSITINTPREADCYEHGITYKLYPDGLSTPAFQELLSGAIQESYAWTPSLSLLANEIPHSTKGKIEVICTTKFKDSDVEIGSKSTSFTVTVPNNTTTQPKVTKFDVSAVDTPFSGVYVQGKSKVKVDYTASSDYSIIESYDTSLLSDKGSIDPYTSPVLSKAGSITITGKVTDARGYYTTKTATITVVDYSRPRVIPYTGKSSIVCTRCNSSGQVDPSGDRLLIQMGRMYSKVISGTQKNFCKLSYSYKTEAQSDSQYSTPVELLAKTATSDYVNVQLPNIVSQNTIAYNIRLIAEDDVGETDVVTILVPSAFATWHSPPGGHGFTLGGYHDPAKRDVFDCKFDAEFQGNITGRLLGLGALRSIPKNEDANNYTEFGAYAVTSNATAATIKNLPSTKAGTLRVWSANGSGNVYEGNYIYILQEYICYDNSAFYRRSILLNGADSTWSYKAWKTIWSE